MRRRYSPAGMHVGMVAVYDAAWEHQYFILRSVSPSSRDHGVLTAHIPLGASAIEGRRNLLDLEPVG